MTTETRSIAAGLSALLLLSIPACNSGKAGVPVASTETTTAPALTEAMRSELGAAAWIREDASYFSTTLRIGDQWKALLGTRAFQKLMSLPAVQMARLRLLQSPIYQGLLAESQRNPLFRSALDVASDAFSREVFIYMGPELVTFLDAVGSVYAGAILARLPWKGSRPGGEAGVSGLLSTVISAVLAQEKGLRVPPMVIGFRLAAPDAARSFLSSALKEAAGHLPRAIEEEEIAGARFHTLKLDLRMAPLEEARRGLGVELEMNGVPRELVEKLDAFLGTQTLALSAGVRGDYLLLSLGATTAHLRTLGEGTSLAASRFLAPVRKRFKAGVISLAYACAGLVSMPKLPVDDCARAVKEILEGTAESLPEGLIPRLEKDVRGLVEDLNLSIPEPAPWISVSFSNSGIESYTFAARDLATDASRPLTILSRAGSSPLLAVASRSAPSRETYGRLAHWIGVAYGYFQDYIVPGIPAADRQELDRFRKLFLPTLRSIHETTEKLLLPAIDGCQGLLAVDGGGLLPGIPGLGLHLSRPLKFPRPALVLELNDADKLVSAFSEYRESLSRFLGEAEKEFGAPGIKLSPPASRPHAGGTLFTYRLPETGLSDFEPHVLISGKHAVLSLSPAQSKDIIESTSQAPGGAVDLAAAAGRGYWVDLVAASRLLLDGAGIVLEEARKRGALPPEGVGFLALHLPELRQVLSTLKSLSGRTYSEDGATVHHSWLKFEDLSDG